MAELQRGFTQADEIHMARALALAQSSLGLASPNPQVGCVLVREDQVLGEGAHLYDARDHAEIVALKQAAAYGHDVQGATAYVTLEPCSHHGRTGPCAEALISAGLAHCVVATVDPNPAVGGRGLARLQAAGIRVTVGLLEARARKLNRPFACSITQGRPFVTLKAGLSADGSLAPDPKSRVTNQPFWLTGPESRAEVQLLRHGSDAILTGIGTVLADDPLLTDRTGLPRRRPLLRIVVDSKLRLPVEGKLVKSLALTPNTLRVFCSQDACSENEVRLRNAGVEVTRLPGSGQVRLQDCLTTLHREQVLSVLVEAGSALNGSFLREGVVDQLIFFYSETELGRSSLPLAEGFLSPFALEQKLIKVSRQTFGRDVCVSGLLRDPWDSTPPWPRTAAFG